MDKLTEDILGIEDLSSPAGTTIGAVDYGNDHICKVRCPGIVGDTANEQGHSKNIMEYLLARARPEARCEEAQERQGEDSCHCPQPVRAVDCKLLAPTRRIDVEGVVGSDYETHR